ncbi:MAG: caspase family protein [Nitrospirota bacterium]
MGKYSIIIIIIFSVIVFSSDIFAARRALLVGIAEYKALPATINERIVSDLRGPIRDVDDMESILVSRFGFSKGDIKVLKNQEATRENIDILFNNWLVKGTDPGDVVLFYFSGHGSTVPDENGDEIDRKDEVLLPYDMVPDPAQNIIVDDEFGSWMRKFKNGTLVVIFDSCYSGGAYRNVGDGVSYLEETSAMRPRFVPVTGYKPTPAVKALPRGLDDVPPSVIFLTASRENQLSWELNTENGFHGGFTFALAEGMNKLPAPSYEELFDYAKKKITDTLRLPQEPQLVGPKNIIVKPAFNIAPLDVSLPAPSVKEEKVMVKIEAFQKGSKNIKIEELTDKLRSLSYVEIVGDDYFDTLVRGRIEGGQYHARLINRIGDTVKVPASADADKLAESITSNLEYIYIVKQLARVSNPDPAFRVDISTEDERRDFRVGENVTFTVSCETDCYLLVLNLDSEGNVYVIFPNKYYRNNFIRAGSIQIPDESMRRNNFNFIFGEPVGEETVKIIATLTPISLEDIGFEEFEHLFDPAGRIKVPEPTRTIFVKKVVENISSGRFVWSEDTIVIRSHR